MLDIYICAVIAIAALILTIVLSVILLVSKKEKRRQMKKIKTAAIVSALTFPLMAAATIYLIIHATIDPVLDYEIPDLTGLSYAECKTAFTGLFDLTIWDMQYSSEYPEGEIISQLPESGIIIKKPFDSNNIEIRCVISKGSENEDAG